MSKPISISFTAPKPPVTSKQPLSKKRPAANLDSDSDNDDNNHREKVHVITAFDATRGGAVGEKPEEEEKGPLVITAMKNRDWRAEAERRRGRGSVWLPPEAFASHVEGKGEEAMEVDTGAGVHYGLQVFQRPTKDSQPPPPPPPPEQAGGEAVEEKTEEEQALAALLSNSSKAPSTTLILPPSSSAGNADWRDEQQAYKADVASRPDVPTLDDYAAVPVEEFGAALLRGMGWREGMELGGRGGTAKQAKLRTVEKRPAFLGIGAKAKEEVPELGTWGKADKPGRKRGGKRVDTTYVPVVLVDKKTGRVVDESAAVEDGKGRGGGGSNGVDRGRWDGRDQERTRDDPDRRRRDRSRDHRDSHRHHSHHHRDRDRDHDRHGDKHRDRERGEKSHRSRDERDNRRRSRDRYERRDRR